MFRLRRQILASGKLNVTRSAADKIKTVRIMSTIAQTRRSRTAAVPSDQPLQMPPLALANADGYAAKAGSSFAVFMNDRCAARLIRRF